MTPGESHNEWYHYYCSNFYPFKILFQILDLIFHKNHPLADKSYEKSSLIFPRKPREISQNISAASIMIGIFNILILRADHNKYHLFLWCDEVLEASLTNSVGLDQTAPKGAV